MKFKIRVTQDVTRSADFEIEADSIEEAEGMALDSALDGSADWEFDDGNYHDTNDTYVSDSEEVLD